MSIHKFGQFRFDADRLELRQRRKRVQLRPKTASVLKTLIGNAPGIVSKRDLALEVWGHEHVSDQSLFQTICELRRALAPLAPVITHPNLGYEWVATPNAAPAPRFVIAAGLVIAAIVALGTGPADRGGDAVAAQYTATAAPAFRSFAIGLSDLSAGRAASAERHFTLAIDENPGFEEARLMRVEALLALGRNDEARAAALIVIDRARTPGDAYAAMAAMDLLSRAGTTDGHTDMALEWALAAARQARTQGFACAAAELEDRVALLTAQPPVTDNPPIGAPAGDGLQAHLENPAPPDFCDEMKLPPGESGALTPASARQPLLCASRKSRLLATA